jgi:hypothetical protein
VIRRLKREIDARTNPPKFCTRLAPQALVLSLTPQEVALSAAFDAFRKAIHQADGERAWSTAAHGQFRGRDPGQATALLRRRICAIPGGVASRG